MRRGRQGKQIRQRSALERRERNVSQWKKNAVYWQANLLAAPDAKGVTDDEIALRRAAAQANIDNCLASAAKAEAECEILRKRLSI